MDEHADKNIKRRNEKSVENLFDLFVASYKTDSKDTTACDTHTLGTSYCSAQLYEPVS